ncbi:MAG: hypothetical protein ACP5N2_02980 [Candidatus Nanoarchaeia archaeon]
MSKGLMKLNDEELTFLEGKIATIDIQKWCPEQCIICARDAKKYAGSMAFDDVREIVESIAEVKNKKRIDLIRTNPSELGVGGLLRLSDSSEPSRYFSNGKTIYDVVKLVNDILGVEISLTTAGWPSGDNYMQEGMKKIFTEMEKGFNVGLMYSIKLVSAQVITEYLQFKQNYVGTGTTFDLAKQFSENSSYAQRLVANLKNMGSVDAQISAQYIDDFDIGILKNYRDCSELFKKEFLTVFMVVCGAQELSSKMDFNYRRFSGGGKAKDLGLHLHQDEVRNNEVLSAEGSIEIPLRKYSAVINSEGELVIEFDMSGAVSLSAKEVPKSYFKAMAHKYKDYDVKISKYYEVFEQLQRKNILK